MGWRPLAVAVTAVGAGVFALSTPGGAVDEPGTYRYEAHTAAPQKAGPVTAAGIRWQCKGTLCAVSGPWPAPGVAACTALARQVGEIRRYGRKGRWLGAKELTRCNAGLGLPRAGPALEPPSPSLKPGGRAGAQPRPRSGVPLDSGGLEPPPGDPGLGGVIGTGGRETPEGPVTERLRLPPRARLAIVSARAIEGRSPPIPGGRALVEARVRNTGGPSPAIQLNTDPVDAGVESEQRSIPRGGEVALSAYVPVGRPTGSQVQKTLRLHQGSAPWRDDTPLDDTTTVRFAIGRPELAITEILGLGGAVRAGDHLELRARVRNTGDAPAPVRLAVRSGGRNPFAHDVTRIEPGRSDDLRFILEVRPERVSDGSFRDEVVLENGDARGLFVDRNPADNHRNLEIPIVQQDLSVLAVRNAWPAVFGGAIAPFEWTVELENTMRADWAEGGHVDVVLYRGTPEAGLTWFHAYQKSVPPLGPRMRRSVRGTFGNVPPQRDVWYTLRAQLADHASDHDRSNDCFEQVWYQGRRSQESVRSRRFDCANERIDALRPGG